MSKKKQGIISDSGDSYYRDVGLPEKDTGLSGRIYEVLMLLFIVLIASFLYSNTLSGPFLFDDKPNITRNLNIRVTELTFDGIRDAAFNSPCSARPLPTYHLPSTTISTGTM